MRLAKAFRITSAATLCLLTSVSMFAAPRGKADFTRYVALGDSLTAGFQSGSLVLTHQQFSYPAIIARQTRSADFQQPLVSEPGIPPELELRSLSPLVIAPKASTNGGPINLSLARPYNNLGIPGATVKDLLTLTGKEAVTGTATSFAQFILRGIGGTAVDQALAQHPTFITVWIGPNDVLGAVLGGTPTLLTPLADFTASYNTLLDKLIAGAPNAGIAVAGVPDPTVVPFATTVPALLINPATSQPVLGPDGKPIQLFGDTGGGVIGALPFGTFVTLGGVPLLSSGFGIPPQIAANFPTLPNAGKPLPDAATITPAESAAITTRANEINAAIITAASVRGIIYVDTPAVLLNVKNHGLDLGGIAVTTKFITGGLFSLDGFHPSDIGYTVAANEFIKTINHLYGKHFPVASFNAFYVNNAALIGSDPLGSTNVVEFTAPAWENLLNVFGITFPPEVRKSRRAAR